MFHYAQGKKWSSSLAGIGWSLIWLIKAFGFWTVWVTVCSWTDWWVTTMCYTTFYLLFPEAPDEAPLAETPLAE